MAATTLTVGDRSYEIFRLEGVERLPYTLRILLENVLRHGEDADAEAIAGWEPRAEPSHAMSFRPARVLHQDFTGVPAIVDLAAMRNAMADLGGDPSRINPLLPSELVIDHSVQVDEYASARARFRNAELEFERNRERYAFLRWGQQAFENFKVVPPNTGIVHQVNLEFLARVVEERDGRAFPDTLLGTDSHTTMINGLGVLGWGVGGIEAEAAMLGEAVSMLVPAGRRIQAERLAARRRDGNRSGADGDAGAARDRRRRKVRRVLRAGRVRARACRPRHDREHVARVRRDVRFLPRRRRDAEVPAADGTQLRSGSRSSRRTARRTCSGTSRSTLRSTRRLSSSTSSSVEPSLAGPRRPQDRVPLRAAKSSFVEALGDVRRRLRQLARRGGGGVVPGQRSSCARRADRRTARRSRAAASPWPCDRSRFRSNWTAVSSSSSTALSSSRRSRPARTRRTRR